MTGNYETLSDDRLLIHSGYEDMAKFLNNKRIEVCRILQHSFVKRPLSSGEGQQYCLTDVCGRETPFTAARNRTQETTVFSLVTILCYPSSVQ
jgi:hypothetical protein